MSIDEAIGERVHQAMWRRRRQQIDVAPLVGMDQSTLSRKMRGKRPWSVTEIYRIARELGMDPFELLPRLSELGPEPALTSDDAVAESRCIPPRAKGTRPSAARPPWTVRPSVPLRRAS